MGDIQQDLFRRLSLDGGLRAIEAAEAKAEALKKQMDGGKIKPADAATQMAEFLQSVHPRAYDPTADDAAQSRSHMRAAMVNETTQIGLFRIMMLRLAEFMRRNYEGGVPTNTDEAVAVVTLRLELRNTAIDHSDDPAKSSDVSLGAAWNPHSSIMIDQYDTAESQEIIKQLEASPFLNCFY